MSANPRKSPSLPQNDPNRSARDRQLREAQSHYVWTQAVATLPGVPLAEKVHFSDDPSIPWLIAVAEVALIVVENQLAVARARRRADTAHADHLDDLRARFADLKARHAEHIGDQDGTDGDSGLIEGAVDLARAGKRARDLRSLLDEAQTLFYDAHSGERVRADALAPYEALFQVIPLPALASTFLDDAEFARLRVAGPNPMLLRRAPHLPQIFPLTEARYQAVMGAEDSLAAAGAEGRLYLLDYHELLSVVPAAETEPQKYISAPLALFAVPRGGRSLRPVAIQCGQDPDRFPIFTPPPAGTTARDWAWEAAKTVVQVAEGSYHELFVHLARTHLLLEAMTVASHRYLAEKHPLNALLIPHFEGTLFINNAASGGLIAAGGPIDHIFAGQISSTELSSANDRLRMDFYAAMPPADFAARGVDDATALPDYPYRDDATLLWEAIHAWVSDYVGVYYKSDADVVGDTELAAWAADLSSEGRVRGFRPISTRGQLVDVVAMVIFTASAQHAAVNYPQAPLMSYAPAISGAAWAPPPTHETDEAAWLAMLPPISDAQEQLSVLHLLGSVYYRPLGEYRSNTFPYPQWLRDPAVVGTGGPLERFRARLTAIEATITARNAERLAPYTFLLPSRVPVSINI